MSTMEAVQMGEAAQMGGAARTGEAARTGMADAREPAKTSPARRRRGLRVTLLSLAVAILLLGAATAGAYGGTAIWYLR
jgi:hypothetical protein